MAREGTMTEAKWLTCIDPQPMLDFLQGSASDRKLRLFAVACCRRIWPLLTEDRCRTAVEVAERYADHQADRRELTAARRAVVRVMNGLTQAIGPKFLRSAAVQQVVAERIDRHNRVGEMAAMIAQSVGGQRKMQDEAAAQCAILRDMVGNPFRPVPVSPNWLTTNVIALGQGIYDERAFDRMPILADALEEAGCTDASILEHCRSGREHVRGCWVVDLVLGKE
jgi:hypothetical protein